MRPSPVLAATLRRSAPVPPLPHPSWGVSGRQETARRLSAGEFWDRLGL